MNSQKLKGKLVEMGKTYNQCAKALGVSKPTFYKKVNGKTKFYVDEMNALGDFLGMTDEEKTAIFLS